MYDNYTEFMISFSSIYENYTQLHWKVLIFD